MGRMRVGARGARSIFGFYGAAAFIPLTAATSISCSDDSFTTARPDDDLLLGTIRQRYQPSAPQDVLDAVTAVTKKYNLPRWFYYSVIHRESSFDRCRWNSDDGRGLSIRSVNRVPDVASLLA